jgi:hypothetical protein
MDGSGYKKYNQNAGTPFPTKAYGMKLLYLPERINIRLSSNSRHQMNQFV